MKPTHLGTTVDLVATGEWQWRLGRRLAGGWLPVLHAFPSVAPTAADGGSVSAVAACGLATGGFGRVGTNLVTRRIPCDWLLPDDHKIVAGLATRPRCTKCTADLASGGDVAPTTVGGTSDG